MKIFTISDRPIWQLVALRLFMDYLPQSFAGIGVRLKSEFRKPTMIRYRSILNVLIVLVAVLVVSCGGPAAKAPTYSTQQIQQFQQYSSRIEGYTSRLSELKTLVDGQKWNDVRSFIHGPLGDLRLQMVSLARDLFPDARATALAQSKDVFNHLVKIDEAAQSGNYQVANENVSEVIEDIKAFLQLVPQA